MTAGHPHQNQAIVTTGKPLADARAAMILLHGRGATAESILTLADELNQPDFAYLAPQAAGYTWYPYSFLSPMPQNEPGITSGIAVVEALVEQIVSDGIPYQHPQHTYEDRCSLSIHGCALSRVLHLNYTSRSSCCELQRKPPRSARRR